MNYKISFSLLFFLTINFIYCQNYSYGKVIGIKDGDTVVVSNSLGAVTLPVSIDARMRVGVCEIPKGLWMRHVANGMVSNALISDGVNDLGGGACFNEALVLIEKAASQ
jgi:anaerobic selenocysteine-containing dehydrogenase